MSVKSILVRGIPEDVHRDFKTIAVQSGQTMSALLLNFITGAASSVSFTHREIASDASKWAGLARLSAARDRRAEAPEHE